MVHSRPLIVFACVRMNIADRLRRDKCPAACGRFVPLYARQASCSAVYVDWDIGVNPLGGGRGGGKRMVNHSFALGQQYFQVDDRNMKCAT